MPKFIQINNFYWVNPDHIVAMFQSYKDGTPVGVVLVLVNGRDVTLYDTTVEKILKELA